MRKLTWTLVALAAAGVVLFVTLPPRAERLSVPPAWQALASRTIAGAYHIHTTRSDGTGDKAAVASAAKRAGLQFVILTDHGDGTRPPDPPEYVDGVLCLDAVEISTDEGHYVALGMRRAPYPLGGAARAVAEDVARLGGFGIAAHPDSPKPALQWRADEVPVDGIEWLNADSEWRDEGRLALARAAAGYFVRPGAALAELLDRPATLARWDRWSLKRPIVALAAADAHGGMRQRDEGAGGLLGGVGIPGYEASFRTFSNRVVLERPLTGDAAADARDVMAAIRAGRVFTTVDAVAAPGLLDFRTEGSALVARTLAPADAVVVLLDGGREVARADGEALRWETGDGGGAYRVEVRVPRMPGAPPVPWLVSNQIFRGLPDPVVHRDPDVVPSTGARNPPLRWRLERDPSSSGILRHGPSEVELEYELGRSRSASPFVALAADLHDQAFRGIECVLSSDRPMRVSVQVRAGESGRWGRSVYVDAEGTTARIPLRDLARIDGRSESPDPRTLSSLLLVVDTVNAAPGAAGRLRVLSAGLVQ